ARRDARAGDGKDQGDARHLLGRDASLLCLHPREGNIMHYSDDGEPQGTAGMPILDVLRHENLVDVCCVVTRYFGGVLLGTGGLVRAYTQGAQVAVAAAG